MLLPSVHNFPIFAGISLDRRRWGRANGNGQTYSGDSVSDSELDLNYSPARMPFDFSLEVGRQQEEDWLLDVYALDMIPEFHEEYLISKRSLG